MKHTIYRVDATNVKSSNPYINTVSLKFTDINKAERVAAALVKKGFRVKGPIRNTRNIETNVKKAIDFVMSEIGA